MVDGSESWAIGLQVLGLKRNENEIPLESVQFDVLNMSP